MSWKKWSHWTKGLIIGLTVGFTPAIYALLNFNKLFQVICKQGHCPSHMEIFIDEGFIIFFIIPAIGGAILGSVFGLIYGKIKQRKFVLPNS